MARNTGIAQRKDYGKAEVFQRSYSRPELLQRRRNLAKVANSRIRRLENAKSDITGERMIDAPWYNTTLSYLEDAGKTRFSESMETKEMEDWSDFKLKREIVVLEEFLSTESSTVSGYREIEENRVNAFIDKGVPEETARSSEFYDFLNSETFSTIVEESVTSEDIIDILDRASDRGLTLEQIISRFEAHTKNNVGGAKALYQRFGLNILDRKN